MFFGSGPDRAVSPEPEELIDMSETTAPTTDKVRGRPRLAPGLGRTTSIRVHMTPDVRAAYERRAEASSTSISTVAFDVLVSDLAN